METVRIYKVTCDEAWSMYETGTGFSLEDWAENTQVQKGWDNGGHEYVLPDGFEVAEDVCGMRHIYDKSGWACRIGGKNTPVIFDGNGDMLCLELAK